MTILFKQDEVENFVVYHNVFSKEDCEKIIDYGNSKEKNVATLIDATQNSYIEKDVRNSNVVWMDLIDEEIKFCFQRISEVVNDANNNFFKFDILGFVERFQFAEYTSPHGNFNWHIDKVYKNKIRKLTAVVMLSDTSSFEGGILELKFNNEETNPNIKQGDIIIFPSYVLHRVTPVTFGTRYTMVGWVTGAQFK